MLATDLLTMMRQGQRPPMQEPAMPPMNPGQIGRVPLQFGGQTIPIEHPLYDVIKRIILEKYQGPQTQGAQG